MSIKFKKAIETESGITIENVYARLEYIHLIPGTKVQVYATYYASESAYKAGKLPIKTNLPGAQMFEYDRVNDGFDVLEFAHESFKQYLVDNGFLETDLLIEL